MIGAMSDTTKELTLGAYIKDRLGDRSVRAMATYAKIGVGTANNLVNDVGNPDPRTLLKVAEYFNEPPETFFRLAGYITSQEEESSRLARLVVHLLDQLPEDRQYRIAETIKLEYKLWQEEQGEKVKS